MSATFERGSLWKRWDLHLHTPSSFDYEDKSVTNDQIVAALIKNQVRVAAVTDHHTIDVTRIRELQRLSGDTLTILPGMELRSDHGGEPIHYITMFPENCDLDHVWTTLQGKLGLTPQAIAEKGGDQRVYVPIEDGAKAARELGGVVSIHAGAKSNSIEGISNRERFQQRIKFDITSNWVDLMEIGQLKDVDAHLRIIFPATGLDKPLVICSDNHKISEYAVKAPLWLRCDPTFRGLLMVIREPQNRVWIGDRPPEVVRVEQNPTKYVESISFQRRRTAPPSGRWFSGEVRFNAGLVAIVGNKGSGKSALADTLGLLGASKNADAFSFLSKQRFRHPVGGHAGHFDATIHWASGETLTRCMADSAKPEETERLKYLPQDHVEKVCNELVGIGERNFEQELKAVIFSHVPEAGRLGQMTLDDLVRFQTGEKQKRVDSLFKQLRELGRARAVLETQADPAVKLEIQDKIKRREAELEALDKAKPTAKEAPGAGAAGAPAPDPAVLRELEQAEAERKATAVDIAEKEEKLRQSERRLAVANRLIEKLENFKKDFDVFRAALREDAAELGIDHAELAALTLKKSQVDVIQLATSKEIAALKLDLNEANPTSLRSVLQAREKRLAELQLKLDAPNRAYQAHLKDLADWQDKRSKLEGSEVEPESLSGLKVALRNFDALPTKIADLRLQQARISLQIHAEKAGQAAVYRTLYEPVQTFIDTHFLAKDKLKLEFRAELANENFAERLLSLLSLNRRGSFMGVDEGSARANELVQRTDWEDAASVNSFLHDVDQALHSDRREAPAIDIQLKDQLLKGKKLEDVFDLLYGLDYVQPRYILRWEGKDLSMLSPGERGTLLLVFYLLIDKTDTPLVIDQPEGNLDNHTVAKVLVDCIREARKRRQVFIVTHNPNLAVVCDADQVIHASMDKANGNAITYTCGSLESPRMSEHITDVLEGTRWAFGVRRDKYEVARAS